MIDIHSHVIYGLDDGARNIEETISMVKMAYDDGIRSIIATPHYCSHFKYDIEEVEKRLVIIREKSADKKMDMKFYHGNECYLDENLLEALLNGKCKTLADSRYVLIELNFFSPIQLEKRMLLDIIDKGYTPIIAHCERLIDRKDSLMRVRSLKEIGCMLQINSSIFFDRKPFWFIRWIVSALQNHTINFVASDSHDITNRKPLLKKSYEFVNNKAGIEIANNVFYTNAQNIIKSALIHHQ